uniref:Uncharacterized protein n=1 Tax=Spironucleus salmonicida TaxID=348837 RepID=V6LLH9_9EUKA|eukprot:EST41549.1 Hypothetical protein SS50377_18886 [Spironucleus salmonicida]
MYMLLPSSRAVKQFRQLCPELYVLNTSREHSCKWPVRSSLVPNATTYLRFRYDSALELENSVATTLD